MKIATMKNCKCEIMFDDLYQTNDHQYRCPHHPKNGIQHVVADCDGGCGKTLTREHGPYVVIKCKECQAIDRKLKDKEYYRRYYNKKKKATMAQIDNTVNDRINQKFDPSLYTKGLSRYLRNSLNEQLRRCRLQE